MSAFVRAFTRAAPIYAAADEQTDQAARKQSPFYYVAAAILITIFIAVFYFSWNDSNNTTNNDSNVSSGNGSDNDNGRENQSGTGITDYIITALLLITLIAPLITSWAGQWTGQSTRLGKSQSIAHGLQHSRARTSHWTCIPRGTWLAKSTEPPSLNFNTLSLH